LIKVAVRNAPTTHLARDLGRFVTNSNLVKCAVAGNDPNVGRIVGAIGSFLGKPERAKLGLSAHTAEQLRESMSLSIGDTLVFESGRFALDGATERALSDYMLEAQLYPTHMPEHERNHPRNANYVRIEIAFGPDCGDTHVETIGSDLTKEYVEVNADYRS
jgi:glutamate N-acetyltransferase/amino-acid N-acetyltransferase